MKKRSQKPIEKVIRAQQSQLKVNGGLMSTDKQEWELNVRK